MNDVLDKMIMEAKKMKETTKVAKVPENVPENVEEKANEKLQNLLERSTDKRGFKKSKVELLAIIYSNLCPNDEDGPISIRMMKEFCKKMEKKNPSDYKKMLMLYNRDFVNEKKAQKAAVFVESFLKQFRTVENCFEYCKSFKDSADKIAKKLNVPSEIGIVEKVKWLRLWVLVIRDQSLFWSDVKSNRRIDLEFVRRFDKEVYFTPELMVTLEKNIFQKIPDNSISLEMLQSFIKLFPDKIQKKFIGSLN